MCRHSATWLATVSVAVVCVSTVASRRGSGATVEKSSLAISVMHVASEYAFQVWAVLAASPVSCTVTVPAWTGAQVPAGVAGTVFMCHQAAAWLARVSVAVVSLTSLAASAGSGGP